VTFLESIPLSGYMNQPEPVAQTVASRIRRYRDRSLLGPKQSEAILTVLLNRHFKSLLPYFPGWHSTSAEPLVGVDVKPLYGVRGGRAVHGASDVSDSQACNQCLCGVWVRSQLAAPLYRIKGIFGAGHVPVVSCGYSGFLHHQRVLFP
jgi:hypothetical protein